ncbi:MAG: hypothetical protein JWR67_1202, partial [Mucilaginibacter sp.]|nr:hypothetical protein [Mucilaginibacter sp.]
RMDALINYNNIPQVKMSNNQFYIAVATATDEEPIYQTYGVQRVAHNNDRKQLHVIDAGKTLNVAL